MNSLSTRITTFMTAAVLTLVPLAVTTAAAGAQELPASSAMCQEPNAPATTEFGAIPEWPAVSIEEQDELTGTTYVRVDLDATGAIIGTAVAKTSGVPLLDRAAIKAARASSFQPEVRDCTPVGGSYLFVVDFPQE
jgi:TonB family protein